MAAEVGLDMFPRVCWPHRVPLPSLDPDATTLPALCPLFPCLAYPQASTAT